MLFLGSFCVRIVKEVFTFLEEFILVKFSAPEERAVKAVITAKNHKTGRSVLYVFSCMILATLIYGTISVFTNKFWTVRELFSDNLWTGLVCFCIATLIMGLYFMNRPITKKKLYDNGRYQVILEGDCVKVLFPDEPEIIVPLSKISGVEEYDIFYLIRCYKNTDEIVCSKNSFVSGDDIEFKKFFEEKGILTKQNEDKKIYVSLLKRIDKKVRAGWASLIYAGLAILLAYPFYWLVVEVLISFVPSVVEVMMVTLLDIPLWTAVLIGVLYIPIVLVSTLVCGVSALSLLAVIPFLIYVSGYYAIKQAKGQNKLLGAFAIAGVVIAVAMLIAVLLFLLNVFYLY